MDICKGLSVDVSAIEEETPAFASHSQNSQEVYIQGKSNYEWNPSEYVNSVQGICLTLISPPGVFSDPRRISHF